MHDAADSMVRREALQVGLRVVEVAATGLGPYLCAKGEPASFLDWRLVIVVAGDPDPAA
jgi:hypothetical protein